MSPKSKSIKNYASHEAVEAKYKWDLSFVLKGQNPQQVMKQLFIDLKALIKIKDSKYESAAKYLKALELAEALGEQRNAFNWWLTHNLNLNLVSADFAELRAKFDFADYEFQQALGPELPRFFKHADDIAKWAKTPAFKDFKFNLEELLTLRPHILSDEVETFRQKQSRADGDFVSVFDMLTNAERERGVAISSTGQKTVITDANILRLFKDEDAAVRKSAYVANANSYYKNRETLALLLYQHKKAEATEASVRNHASSLAMFTFADGVTPELVSNLLNVTAQHVHIGRAYFKSWVKFYTLRYGQKPTKYDYARELTKQERFVDVETGIAEVKAALAAFGSDYLQVVNRAFEERWVDFFVVPNKLSGAYSDSTYTHKQKLILMNWDYTANAVETLAHELGHSLHSHYSDQAQRAANSRYDIFVAEIASIFNELLMHDYWLKNAKDDQSRFEILSRIISGFNGTVFRQALFASYETSLYEALDRGEPVNTFRAQSALYETSVRKFALAPQKDYRPLDLIGAIYVPHYYYGFYVYKYALGQLVANIFFAKFKAEGKSVLDQFIKQFLSAGGSKSNLNTLKDAGVDLTDPTIWNLGFSTYEAHVAEWTKLGNKLFNKNAKLTK